jgi:hypothetical protein
MSKYIVVELARDPDNTQKHGYDNWDNFEILKT